MFAPAGTPRPIIDRLNTAIVKAVRSPEIEKRLETSNAEAVGSTPEELAEWMKKATAQWRKVAQRAGIRPE